MVEEFLSEPLLCRDHAADLLAVNLPAVLAADFKIIPTDRDVDVPDRWRDVALFCPEVREMLRELVNQGWKDAPCDLHPNGSI